MTTRSTRRAKSAGVRSPDRPGRRDAETVDAGSPAGGGGRRLRRADSGAAGLSRRLLHSRSLVTRIGKLELRVPRARDGRCSTERFARDQRSEKALVSALAEMSVQGVSTRTVKVITDELCGHTFSGEPHQPDQHEPGRRAVADSTPRGGTAHAEQAEFFAGELHAAEVSRAVLLASGAQIRPSGRREPFDPVGDVGEILRPRRAGFCTPAAEGPLGDVFARNERGFGPRGDRHVRDLGLFVNVDRGSSENLKIEFCETAREGGRTVRRRSWTRFGGGGVRRTPSRWCRHLHTRGRGARRGRFVSDQFGRMFADENNVARGTSEMRF